MAIDLRYTGLQLCLTCEKELSGRSDKKFCNDRCRNIYNSKRQQSIRAAEPLYIKMVIEILRRNRKILSSLNPVPGDPVIVHRAKLINLNFNFDFITSTLDTHKGHHYRYCFEYGYRILEDAKVMVVASDSQMEML
jgi:predicted nucleic acid-binding Zn ribbon protein